jgi:hypothetical protein
MGEEIPIPCYYIQKPNSQNQIPTFARLKENFEHFQKYIKKATKKESQSAGGNGLS